MLVITTPTGRIGSRVLDRILSSTPSVRQEVRVIVRNPERLPPTVRDRVDVVVGSLTDKQVLEKGLEGADSVFWLLPPDPDASSVSAHLRDFVPPLRDAIDRCGVPRLVYVSGLDSGLTTSGPSESALDVNRAFAQTGAALRAVKLPALMENLLQQAYPIAHQGVFRYPVDGDLRLPSVATADVASCVADIMLDDSWHDRQDVALLGPEDISYNEMAVVMSEGLERPIRYEYVSASEFRELLVRNGMADAWAASITQLLVDVDHGAYSHAHRTADSVTPTTFRQWCHDVLRPAIDG